MLRVPIAHQPYPTLSKYSQNSIFFGSEQSLIKYPRRNFFLCRIWGLFSSGCLSNGPSKLVLRVSNARAVISYCKSFLYTMLTIAGTRAFMYLAPFISASISPITSCQHLNLYIIILKLHESVGEYSLSPKSRKLWRYSMRASRFVNIALRSICFMGIVPGFVFAILMLNR